MIDVIEDAFLAALEQGARPPQTLTIHLQWEAWLAVGSRPHLIAGFVIHFRGDDRYARSPRWEH